MRLNSLIDAAQKALQQELDLLAVLTPEAYCAPSSGPYESSIGMHIRHVCDHFDALFTGMDQGQIDYEARGRNTILEESLENANQVVQQVIVQLDALRSVEGLALQVREESEANMESKCWLSSSIGRELQFLLGHTVHHNALIAMIAHAHGLVLPESFGLAPSTQRHLTDRSASS